MVNKKIQCQINGVPVEVSEGTTIIQAIKKINQDIAHYCWHPGLSVAGVCRLCMVDIKGQNKLQIACNTKVQEGMVISNQTSKVKEAVRWGLEFHLINHPLDCPICDQAGECELQDQYMKFGTYTPTMAESKVKKRKVVNLGSKIVLDTERCILCSRCVRFTDEVTKTRELGIFNRGDRSEIGVFKDRPLENNYALNTVDICPVGALTSKKFRFQQRVWYMKTSSSICTGCSTGCNIFVDYNEEGLWRVRPRYNPKVNGYWMCDKGREIYKNSNKESRMHFAYNVVDSQWNFLSSKQVLLDIKKLLSTKHKIGFVLTGQYTNQEYEMLLKSFPKSAYYHWVNQEKHHKDFDGLLLRGDKNPNTLGLKQVFPTIKTWKEFETDCPNLDWVFVLGPENSEFYPELQSHTRKLVQAQKLVWMSVACNPFLDPKPYIWQIPMKSFFEKQGEYTNFKGLKQGVQKVQTLIPQALDIQEFLQILKGEEIHLKSTRPYFKSNQFLKRREKLW